MLNGQDYSGRSKNFDAGVSKVQNVKSSQVMIGIVKKIKIKEGNQY